MEEVGTITIKGKTYELCDRKARAQLETLAEKVINTGNGSNEQSSIKIFTMTGYQPDSIRYNFEAGGSLEGVEFKEDKCFAKATFHFEAGEYSIMMLSGDFNFDYNLVDEYSPHDNSFLHLKNSKGENILIGTGYYDNESIKLFTIPEEGDYTFEYEGYNGSSVCTDTFMVFKAQTFASEYKEMIDNIE